ncbi:MULTISPECIES: FBP domain-containing protein [unclassified Rathayibacter]|uniref:FBP domain-containing protein n=1 Tax=unclassified Rathayibacter TaxID=2609250 RepID=UPI00188BBD66|nr:MULTISPECIES: FBP domain-containing protein [unclassified Rathayibacter]MBF4461457.1 FBP domain-containing protein [Rathayibacter sp. VKM Ac-2879]MBF4502868.1 FBP domain-containing protein [Rathayibacter sp. VKM Ac-2878]
MTPLTEHALRESFVNASRKEVADLSLPHDFETLDWDTIDYLGWRDRKMSRRSYVVAPLGERVVGVLLTQADARPRSRAQCSWCRDVRLPNDVVFFGARKAGAAGRAGDTLGTLVCSEFQCSANVRQRPPIAYVGFDVEAAKAERIATLRAKTAGFVREVLGEA